MTPEDKMVMQQHVRNILTLIGEKPNREGLKDTPARVVKMWKEIFAGYNADIKNMFTKVDVTNKRRMV